MSISWWQAGRDFYEVGEAERQQEWGMVRLCIPISWYHELRMADGFFTLAWAIVEEAFEDADFRRSTCMEGSGMRLWQALFRSD